jgi:hypothetical protein
MTGKVVSRFFCAVVGDWGRVENLVIRGCLVYF